MEIEEPVQKRTNGSGTNPDHLNEIMRMVQE